MINAKIQQKRVKELNKGLSEVIEDLFLTVCVVTILGCLYIVCCL